MAARHGGNLRDLAQTSGLNQDQILDFSASINPLGPPESLRPVLARSIDRLVHYPDPSCSEIVEVLARQFHTAAEQIVVGNGSTEIFYALARALPFTRAVVPVPSYIGYTAAVRAAGREACCVLNDSSHGFALDWDRLQDQLCGDEIVLLGQPNNPTGRTFDADAFRSFAARNAATTFVVDEAFADFIDGYRSLAEGSAANVIVVRSLTKFYAIPGLRLGFALASPAIADRIRAQIPTWSVSTLAQDAAVALLSDEAYVRRTIALVDQQRRWLAAEFAKLPVTV